MSKFISSARKLLDALDKQADPEPPVAPSSAEVAALKEQVERLSRRSLEYFDLIERMEMQREEWKEMYYTQSRAHGVAQQMLFDTVNTRNQQLTACLGELNVFRQKHGIGPVKGPEDLKSPPIGTIEQFKALIAELEKSKPEELDGKAARDKLGPPDGSRLVGGAKDWTGPARFNEAGQPVEDDDVPDEDR